MSRARLGPESFEAQWVARQCHTPARHGWATRASCGDAKTEHTQQRAIRGGPPWVMSMETTPRFEVVKSCPIAALTTDLERARCAQPARVERMKQSLMTHGQLTPLIVTQQTQQFQLVDGFKRLAAAKALGWPTLQVVVRDFDETAKWIAMVLLNRGAQSMVILEEAMVLRELTKVGLSQTSIADLLSRHKTWVSRRIGLIERLHPELIESMKLGRLQPGAARRLLSLPPGNQLEFAAVIQRNGLRSRETENLVSLWQSTKDPSRKAAILFSTREALRSRTKKSLQIDSRLTPTGQKLQRALRRLSPEVSRIAGLIKAIERPEEIRLLSQDLQASRQVIKTFENSLGSLTKKSSDDDDEGNKETN